LVLIEKLEFEFYLKVSDLPVAFSFISNFHHRLKSVFIDALLFSDKITAVELKAPETVRFLFHCQTAAY
jgi:hypothetical protein